MNIYEIKVFKMRKKLLNEVAYLCLKFVRFANEYG